LIHTWSLGVEEQFYIFFPLLLYFVYSAHRKSLLPMILASLAAMSLALSIWLTDPRWELNSTLAFFLSPSRAFELLIGALLAIGAFPQLKGQRSRDLLSLAGLS
jgi:peptidoglycan/LPS O-acetylase OafA/YrhL